ncbi:MAG: sodium-dependent transporter [Candidatus Cloacimonetes bacterium]|nr:sodium-dependent transporter [Candidatus Cloacimonadota bacterium]
MSDLQTATSSGSAAPGREQWTSRFGFLMAAVGSAVGLGNMWRFAYIASEHGGAAAVLLYVLLVFAVGVPVMIAELALGRSSGLSPIGAMRQQLGRAWAPFGVLFILAGALILSYYAVIAGWVLRYAIVGLTSSFPADAGTYFGSIAAGGPAIVFQIVIMAVTTLVVARGIGSGIERLSSFMMPALFLILVGLAIWAMTLPGGGEGYAYYLIPRFEELFSLETLAASTSQAFFSLSLGMGAMLTFASYLPRTANLPKDSTTIALADFSVAFIAGLVVFPVIYALGLQGAVGESTLGALFISLPGGFAEMGSVGRVVGLFFFTALLFGALTSTVSLLEVVVASMVDETKMQRPLAALVAGGLITLVGLWSALDTNALGFLDAVANNVMLPLGGLVIAMGVAWKMPDARAQVSEGTSPRVARLLGGWLWTLRIVVPPLLIIVLYETIPAAIEAARVLFGGN